MYKNIKLGNNVTIIFRQNFLFMTLKTVAEDDGLSHKTGGIID
ncbi:hypothetical protein CIT292_10576 [Citrobacter youngae ATCC 29220]|uniref:Uncharacterized protein n=1 Tax=Citrobacter youngae ATCC 29220 TaxID=500640 RepID=D4BJ59_9ENTR|nr:hypothetical protein CIT292_10576 [Citrobacter youngae ATCC 29220]